MRGVVSPLNAEHAERMQALWQALRQEFGPGGIHPAPIPHLTYHAAEDYDLERLTAAVRSIARSVPPFQVATNGVAIFPGETRVIYLPVVRHSRLTVVQRAIFEQVKDLATGSSPVWLPENWVPHLTLAALPAEDARLGPMVAWLACQDLAWQVTIAAFGIGEDSGSQQKTLFEAPIAG